MDKAETASFKLGPNNYHAWKLLIKATLQSKNLTDYIDGTATIPNDRTPDYENAMINYKKRDATAQTIIINSLDLENINLIVNAQSALEMYRAIVNHREQKTTSNEWTMRRNLSELKFTTSHTVTSYLTELNTIVKQMRDADIAISEASVMLKILDDLPSQFETIRQTIDVAINAGTSIDYENLKNQLLIFEKRYVTENQVKKGEALVSKNSFRNNAHNQIVTCFKCGHKGHKANVCRTGKNNRKFNNNFNNNNNQQNAEDYQNNSSNYNNHSNTSRNFNKHKKPFNRKFNNTFKRTNFANNASQQSSNQNNNQSNDVAFTMNASSVDDNTWLLDTGASFHLTKNIENMVNIQLLDKPIFITVGNGVEISAIKKGDMPIQCFNGSKWINCTIHDVLYVPELGNFNLFSWGQTVKKGFGLRSTKDYTEIYRVADDKTIIVATTFGNTFKLAIRNREEVTTDTDVVDDNACCEKEIALTLIKSDLREWHEKLGHINIRKIIEMSKTGLLPKIDVNIDLTKFGCKGCLEGKMAKRPFKSKPKRQCNVGEIFHCDLEGPMHIPSLGGSKFALVIKDECSSFRSLYFLKQKSDAINSLTAHIAYVKRITGNPVKTVRSDNGTEFIDQRVETLFSNNNIVHERTVPYNPQQNGFIERENRTVCELARAMIHHRNLPRHLWCEAMSTAAYLLNIIPKKGANGITPFEQWHKKKPSYDHLHEFGCNCYGLIPPETRQKWDPKCRRYLFVGYTATKEIFRVYEPNSEKVLMIRDVKFNLVPEDCIDRNETWAMQRNRLRRLLHPNEDADNYKGVINENSLYQSNKNDSTQNDNVTNESTSIEPNNTDQQLSEVSLALASIIYKNDPQTFEEAMKSDNSKEWFKAMQEELNSLNKNDTYDIVSLPNDKKPISCRWIFRIKKNIDGSIDRFKARLVARGYSQKEGIDYFETFSPVARYDSIRLILAIASAYKMEILQFDVKTAFLYGELDEEIFMQQPPGFEDGTDKVLKLKRGLYGLKQAPRQWNAKINEFLINLGFTQSKADNCVYVDNNNDLVICAIYVDDGLIVSTSKPKLLNIINKLQEKFEMKFHPPQIFVGMEITQSECKSVIKIKQTSYIKELLQRFKMLECKPVVTPGDTNAQLIASETGCDTNIPYQEAVGALLYLSIISRPDITYQINKLSQFNNCYNNSHWVAIKRVFRYLKGTINQGIVYAVDINNFQPIGYCDSDYAGDLNSRKSTSGHTVTIDKSPISWASRVQKSVALSTTEAEYYAIADCAKDIIWYQQLFEDLSLPLNKPTLIFSDNQGAIKLSKNAIFHKRSKHVDVRVHFIRDHQAQGTMLIQYVPTDKQPADMFTKSLASPSLNNCKLMLNIGE